MNLKPLIDRSLQGDEEAFNTIIKIFDSSIRSYVVSLCGNEFDSNDIIQETYIKAFLNLSKFNSKYPMDVWLKTIAHNVFIDIIRKNNNLKTPSFVSDILYDVDELSPEAIIITKERIRCAEKEISLLPERYKNIIDLRYFRFMSYTEIAAELDMPLGTVKTHLFRAKKMLTKIINDLNKI